MELEDRILQVLETIINRCNASSYTALQHKRLIMDRGLAAYNRLLAIRPLDPEQEAVIVEVIRKAYVL